MNQVPMGINRHAEYLQLARRVTGTASQMRGVEGVLLLGGLARGYCDVNSDIDISVIVSSDVLSTRRRMEELGRRLEQESGVETDIEVHSLAGFCSQEWGDVERFTFKGARIDFDRTGEVGRAMQEKLQVPKEEWKRRAVEGCTYLSWYACPEPPHPSMAETWMARGSPLQAHWCMDHATGLIVELVYSLNQEFLPPAKWRIFYLSELPWQPSGLMDRLEEMMRVGSLDDAELHRRLGGARALWPDILARMRNALGMDLEHIKQYYVTRVVYGSD